MERVEMESFLSLVVQNSSYETDDGKDIGLGLFAGITYRATQKIAYFRGEVVPMEIYDKRANQRYGLQIGERWVLDCSDHVQKGLCKASRANDARGLVCKDNRDVSAEPNCRCVPNVTNKYLYLEAIKAIKVGEELFWDYGDEYGMSP